VVAAPGAVDILCKDDGLFVLVWVIMALEGKVLPVTVVGKHVVGWGS